MVWTVGFCEAFWVCIFSLKTIVMGMEVGKEEMVPLYSERRMNARQLVIHI